MCVIVPRIGGQCKPSVILTRKGVKTNLDKIYVSLVRQIELLSKALRDIVERSNGVDAYKIRDIRTIAEGARSK